MVAMSNLNLARTVQFAGRSRRQLIWSYRSAGMSDGTRKVVSIAEITGMEGDIVTMPGHFHFPKARDSGERGSDRRIYPNRGFGRNSARGWQ